MPVKILYVDDDTLNRKLVQKMLKSFDYTYFDAADGQTGIQKALHEQPHLIIMDYMMPGLSGLQTVDTLKQMPQTAHIPIIMLTADMTELDEQSVRLRGCEALLHKPVSMNMLLRTIVQIVNNFALAG